MKSYKCLDFLEEKGIDFIYTPFDQGATTHILNPEWRGSCNALSHEWMERKIWVKDIMEPTSYRITEPHLPHPVIIGDNKESPERIHNNIRKLYQPSSKDQYNIDKHVPSIDIKIDKLLSYIEAQKFHYGIIETGLYITNPDGPSKPLGHAVSFVKRGNAISWFDPNYGEITFSNFKDFKLWFKQEVKKGALNYIFSMADHEYEKTYQTLADVFTQPQFTEEQKQHKNPIVQQIIATREAAHERLSKITNFDIYDYTIKSYTGNRFITKEEAFMSPLERFKAEHQKLLTRDKNGFFSRWYQTEIKNNWDLSDYLKHAIANNNRSREAFINLTWMNKDGTLTNNAPDEVREAYYEALDNPVQLKH